MDWAEGSYFLMLSTLKRLAIYNPDISQAVANLKYLANTGHTVKIEAKTPAQIDLAQARLAETAARVFLNSAGLDGFVGNAISTMAWSGALSIEATVDLKARQLDRIIFVPIEEIHFHREGSRWIPYQHPKQGLGVPATGLALNDVTYRYFAAEFIENSPYARPPFTAAIDPILSRQNPMMASLKAIAEKFGLTGVVNVSVEPPPRDKDKGETVQQYNSRLEAYIGQIRQRFENNPLRSLWVTYRDYKVEHHNITSDARGAKDLVDLNEQQVLSAIHSMPAFHGRADSTTEAFANVVYRLLIAQAENFQRIIKRALEFIYKLDLMLAGIEVESLSVKFHPMVSRNPKEEAEAEATRLATAILKAEKGLLDPDQAAQEVGADSWFDQEKIGGVTPAKQQGKLSSATFRYDQGVGTYELIHRSEEVPALVIRLEKKKRAA